MTSPTPIECEKVYSTFLSQMIEARKKMHKITLKMNCARRDQTLHHAHHGHQTNQETVAAKSANNVQQQSAELSSHGRQNRK